MKKSYRILAFAFFSACAFSLSAQKIGHLNYDSLVSGMPETKTATEAAQNFLKGMEQELLAMQGELDSKYKEYLEKEPGMSDLVKKSKQEDLQQLQTRIQDFQRQAENEYKRKQAELTAPIMEKAKKAIEAVAKEGSFKYVLDTSPQTAMVLYSESGDDIMGLVKKKLETMPLATIPGSKPAGTDGMKTGNGGKTSPPPPAKKTGK
jgi:outer membrane protein